MSRSRRAVNGTKLKAQVYRPFGSAAIIIATLLPVPLSKRWYAVRHTRCLVQGYVRSNNTAVESGGRTPPQICTKYIPVPYVLRKKLKNVSCEYDRLNGWSSTLQAAWYISHVRIIWFLWTKRTIWLLILSSTQNIARACYMFYPYEGYRPVTPLDAARVNRTIFHDHSVHWYY